MSTSSFSRPKVIRDFAKPCTNKSYEPLMPLSEVVDRVLIFNFGRISTKLVVGGTMTALCLADRARDLIADRSKVVKDRILDVALGLTPCEIYGDGSKYLERTIVETDDSQRS